MWFCAMPWRRDRGQFDPSHRDRLAVTEGAIWRQSPVAVARQRIDLEPPRRPAQPVLPGEPEWCAGLLPPPRRARRVVLVGVGQDDRLDPPTADRPGQRLAVRWH